MRLRHKEGTEIASGLLGAQGWVLMPHNPSLTPVNFKHPAIGTGLVPTEPQQDTGPASTFSVYVYMYLCVWMGMCACVWCVFLCASLFV